MYKDRIGRWTQFSYDSIGKVASAIDPLGRKTSYVWCTCGSLSSLVDPAGRITRWQHDLEGKTTKKIYPDGTACSYTYTGLNGLLNTRTDANGLVTQYYWNNDLTLNTIQGPTENVIYTWDQSYKRIASIQNYSWGTISWTYVPYITTPTGVTTGAGQEATASNNVIPNSTISYSYDALGRATNRSINGASNSTTWVYDAMSRVTSEQNPLGTFNYAYVNDTPGASKGDTRLASVSYPNGQVTSYDYFPTALDERLKQIRNATSSGALMSQFNYQYDAAGQITQWPQIQNNNSNFWTLGYDSAGQLTSAQVRNGTATGPNLSQYHYDYDPAANRTSQQRSQLAKIRISGTISAGAAINVIVSDAALSSGQQTVSYTTVGGDTTSTVATKLAAAITADSKLAALGVNAVATGPLITVQSLSPNTTTISTSGAALTSLASTTANFVENAVIGGTKTTGDVLTINVFDPALPSGSQTINYTVLAGDTLSSIATGLKNAINANSNLSSNGITASSVGTTITITSSSPNATTYTQSISSGATETISLYVNPNGVQTVLVGGTLTVGQQLKLSVYDAALTGGGPEVITYTTAGGDTPTSMATGLKNAINASTNLQNIGVSATSSGPVVAITSNSTNLTTYRDSSNPSLTETLTFSTPQNGITTALVGGTVTAGNVITATVYDASLSGGSRAVSYTVLSGDTLASIAAGIANAVHSDAPLNAAGIDATSSSNVVNLISGSVAATTYTISVNSGGTETITLAPATSTISYGYNATNALTNIASGGAVRFAGTTSKAIKSANVSTPVISLKYNAKAGNSFTRSQTGGTTITLGTNSAGNVTATVGGSVTTGTVQSITVANPSISGGTETVSYTVQSGDTTTSIATALTNAMANDAALKAVGVSATSSTNVITFQTYPTYSTSLSGSATETLTSGPNLQGREFVTVGGATTAGDVVHVIVHDSRLTGGIKDISYTVASGDSLITIAGQLAANVNADADLAAIRLTAVGGAAASLPYSKEFDAKATLSPGQLADNVSVTDAQSTPATKTNTYQFVTAYTGYSATASGTETILFGQNSNGKTSATISGTATAGDVLTLTAYSASLPTGSRTVTYTAAGGDTATIMATALKNAINADAVMLNAGITATSSVGVLTIDVNGGVGTVLVYDANGNLISDGTNSYSWDWENRLVKITYPGTNNFTDMVYDGLGRNVKIVETTSGSVTSTKQFVWCDNERCEERDNTGAVTKQFFDEGERISGTPYYFHFDHLDSMREMTNSSGTIVWQQSFDPWGVPTTLVSTTPADFGFGGYYVHNRSSLNLTASRAYSASLGRFINRDPIEEAGGINLYGYVSNDPTANTDPSGHGCNKDYECCTTEECCDAMLARCLSCHAGSSRCCYRVEIACKLGVKKGGTFSGTNTWARCANDTDAKKEKKEQKRRQQKGKGGGGGGGGTLLNHPMWFLIEFQLRSYYAPKGA